MSTPDEKYATLKAALILIRNLTALSPDLTIDVAKIHTLAKMALMTVVDEPEQRNDES